MKLPTLTGCLLPVAAATEDVACKSSRRLPVRSSPRGDFRQFIGDKLRKVPFGERASHDAQLLRRRVIAPTEQSADYMLRPVH